MFKKTASTIVLLMVSGCGYAMQFEDTDPNIFPQVLIPTILPNNTPVYETGFESDFDGDNITSDKEGIKNRKKIKKKERVDGEMNEELKKKRARSKRPKTLRDRYERQEEEYKKELNRLRRNCRYARLSIKRKK